MRKKLLAKRFRPLIDQKCRICADSSCQNATLAALTPNPKRSVEMKWNEFAVKWFYLHSRPASVRPKSALLWFCFGFFPLTLETCFFVAIVSCLWCFSEPFSIIFFFLKNPPVSLARAQLSVLSVVCSCVRASDLFISFHPRVCRCMN